MLALLLAGCPELTSNSISVDTFEEEQVEACGEDTTDLIAGQHTDAGDVTISNDEETLTITIETQDGWELSEVHIHVGCSLSDFPTRHGGPVPGQFDTVEEGLEGTTYQLEIPLADIDCLVACGDDILVAVHASVTRDDGNGGTDQETAWGDGDPFPGANWATITPYTVACCEEDPEDPEDPECDGWRTQTQGGWGAAASGNNPGTYRDANFAECIGELVVGGESTLTLTSAAAVEAFLPQGGTPSALDGDEVDPLQSSGGVLAGQVVALSLSVAFDACDPDFSEQEGALGDLVAQRGDCASMTVDEILSVANCVLGGGDCGMDPSTVNDCVSDANQAFVDGHEGSGFLCE